MRKKQKFVNTRKNISLQELDVTSLDDEKSDLTIRSQVNFSYFEHTQTAGQNFSDLSKAELDKLLNALHEFSRKSLDYWENQGTRFVIYDKFPLVTEFKHPKHVPHQACWGRFRLGSKFRLVGFRVPASLHGIPHDKTKELYDKNTFYIVFIDKYHLFWKTKKR